MPVTLRLVVVVEVALSVVKAPVEATDAPTAVPLMLPPEMETAFAFWTAIVPRPVT